MKVTVQFPDPEPPVVEYLREQFALLGDDVNVGVNVPSTWTPAAKPHVQVAWDGTPIVIRGVLGLATVRLVARAANSDDTKALANRAQAILCGMPGDDEVTGAAWLTGVLPARDPDTDHEIASTTSRVTIRSAPIEPTGS